MVECWIRHVWSYQFGDHGWGNGYVLLSPGHPLHGISHEDFDNDALSEINVHGGLTFSGLAGEECYKWECYRSEFHDWWVFGFDTGHYGDGISWDQEAVLAETEYLKQQMIKIEENVKFSFRSRKLPMFGVS